MSSETTYTIDFAKSGRAKCRKCKTPITKGEMKIVTSFHNGQYDVSQSFKVGCFTLPRKYAGTVDDFVDEELQDATSGDILPKERDAIVASIISSKAKSKPGKGATASTGDSSSKIDSIINKLKDMAEDSEPLPKKAKTEDPFVTSDGVAAFRSYQKSKNGDLKEVLKYNRQFVGGTKNYLLIKCVDGHIRGRLARCKLCSGGKLKINETDCTTVSCNGAFDEDSQRRIPCSFECRITEAPRWKPWYTEEPSEEEQEAMDQLEAKASGEGGGGGGDDPIDQIQKEAANLEWNLGSKSGIRAAAKEAVALLRKHEAKLPDDDAAAVKKVGPLLMAHKNSSPQEIIAALLKDVGKAVSEEAKENKAKAVEKATKVPANAPLVAAFQELAELYFKEGNRNAGTTYNKVVTALKDLSYEVTEENAMSLSKGKTKVPGVGKSSAQKIQEYCRTGTMQKLEEKRADNA